MFIDIRPIVAMPPELMEDLKQKMDKRDYKGVYQGIKEKDCLFSRYASAGPRTVCYSSSRCTVASAPSSRSCAFRTGFFTGRTNEPDLLSGKTEVVQREVPIVTMTRTDPNPLRRPSVNSVMSSAQLSGSVMKYHARQRSLPTTIALTGRNSL